MDGLERGPIAVSGLAEDIGSEGYMEEMNKD